MRSSERVDSSGIGRSKGFAFVDFTAHESALEALRATNNNPGLFGPKKVSIHAYVHVHVCVTMSAAI